MPEDFTNQIDIHYIDGKLVRKNKDPQKEIKKELNSEEPENMFDDTKRQLYANTPKAELKKDKSITARQLNQTLESYNSVKFRGESSQKNEDGASWFVTLELRAPSSMNNKAVEDKLEKVIEQNGITVLDVTAERR